MASLHPAIEGVDGSGTSSTSADKEMATPPADVQNFADNQTEGKGESCTHTHNIGAIILLEP